MKNIYRIIKYKIRSLVDRKTPDFIIIGVQKGGTTFLFDLLSNHEKIKPPIAKEIHYFDKNYFRGKRWYLSHFPRKTKSAFLTGEASPYYVFHPEVPNRIHSAFPNTKLILILRNPTDRAYSHFQMEVRKGNEEIKDFNKAIQLEKQRIIIPRGKFADDDFYSFAHQHFSYLSRGNYYDQINNLYKYFQKEQILILTSEDMFKSTKQTLDKITLFLNIDNFKHIPENLRANLGSYKPIPHDIKVLLDSYYANEVKKIEKLLNQKLPWY